VPRHPGVARSVDAAAAGDGEGVAVAAVFGADRDVTVDAGHAEPVTEPPILPTGGQQRLAVDVTGVSPI